MFFGAASYPCLVHTHTDGTDSITSTADLGGNKEFLVQANEHGISWLIQWFFIQSVYGQSINMENIIAQDKIYRP